MPGDNLIKEWDWCASEMSFVLLSFKFTCLYIYSTCHSISSWSFPYVSQPTTNMSSAMSNTLGKFLNILHWNMSPMWAAPNGSLLYLYLPKWHPNVVRYDDLLSNFRLWYLELTFIRDKYFTLFNFGKISLSVGPLWTGLISAWLSLSGSRHSLTLPLGFGTSLKLLHHSAISHMPNGGIYILFWSLSISSLNSFWSAYATHHGGAWYGVLSAVTCNENVPSQHPIPVNISSNFFCSCFVISVLAFWSPLLLGPGRKYSISLLFNKWVLSGLLLKFELPWLSVFVSLFGLEKNIQSHYY